MNIFYLDNDMKKCAEYHVNKHVVKMLVEQNQLLCSAYYFTDSIPDNIYTLTHKSHPCAVWTRQSLSNWIWLRDFTLALYEEYQYRYGKIHKSGELTKTLPIPNLPDSGITKRPQAMPFEYQDLDPVVAYRNYYRAEKKHLLQYTKRQIPDWITKQEYDK